MIFKSEMSSLRFFGVATMLTCVLAMKTPALDAAAERQPRPSACQKMFGKWLGRTTPFNLLFGIGLGEALVAIMNGGGDKITYCRPKLSADEEAASIIFENVEPKGAMDPQKLVFRNYDLKGGRLPHDVEANGTLMSEYESQGLDVNDMCRIRGEGFPYLTLDVSWIGLEKKLAPLPRRIPLLIGINTAILSITTMSVAAMLRTPNKKLAAIQTAMTTIGAGAMGLMANVFHVSTHPTLHLASLGVSIVFMIAGIAPQVVASWLIQKRYKNGEVYGTTTDTELPADMAPWLKSYGVMIIDGVRHPSSQHPRLTAILEGLGMACLCFWRFSDAEWNALAELVGILLGELGIKMHYLQSWENPLPTVSGDLEQAPALTPAPTRKESNKRDTSPPSRGPSGAAKMRIGQPSNTEPSLTERTEASLPVGNIDVGLLGAVMTEEGSSGSEPRSAAGAERGTPVSVNRERGSEDPNLEIVVEPRSPRGDSESSKSDGQI